MPWNFHEDVEGRFDFEEDRHVADAFADEVRKLDLLLILRMALAHTCAASGTLAASRRGS